MYAFLVPNKKAWRRRPGMGDVCNVDRYGNRVCAPSPPQTIVSTGRGAALNIPVRPVGPAFPVSPLEPIIPATPYTPPQNCYWVGSGPAAGRACDPRSMVAEFGVSCQCGGSAPPPTPQYPSYPTPPWGGWNPSYGSGSSSGISAQQLAQLIQIYQTNPTALTQSQWSQLQAAGIIPSTLPYSSASLIAPTTGTLATGSIATAGEDPMCLAAGMTGGPYPNCTPLTSTPAGTDFFSTTYGPLTGLEWLLVAGGAFLLFKRK